MEIEFIKNEVDIEKSVKGGAKGRYAPIIEEWLKTDNKTLKFACSDIAEKKRVYASVNHYKRTHDVDYVIWLEKNKTNVYLVKA